MTAVLLLVAQVLAQGKTPDRHLYQIGTFAALSAGRYDGDEPVGRLVAHGNFGVGTFNGLDGEMIVLDSQIYHADGFGDVDTLPMSTKTPFACVVNFQPDLTITLDRSMSSGELQAMIDARVKDPERILAIRIDGTFTGLQARAYPPQIRPYQPFGSLKDAQSLFSFPKIECTFIGFRMPNDIGVANVPGYHFHFVDRPGTRAGHVLSYRVESGTVRIMFVDRNIIRI